MSDSAGKCSLLFAYGTLIPGHEPAGMSPVVRQLTLLGPATIRARLYDLGPYPGVIIDNSPLTVRGQLLEVPDSRLWNELDRYEGCPRPDSTGGLFQRVRATATRQTGETAESWVYIYNLPLVGATLVEGGCWLTHRGRITI